MKSQHLRQESSSTVETIDRSLVVVNLALVIIVGIIWFSISLDQSDILAWYQGGQALFSIFNQEALRRFVPFWVIVLATRVLALSAKLAHARYNFIVILSTVISYTTTAFMIIRFLLQDDLLTANFEQRMSNRGVESRFLIIVVIATILVALGYSMYKSYVRLRRYFLSNH